MIRSVEIHRFDIENHDIYAVKDMKTGDIAGLIFQDPDSPFSTIVSVKESAEVAEVDLFACAERIASGNPLNSEPMEKTREN